MSILKRLSRSKNRDMTKGNIALHLIFYSIPIFLSNLFQTFYAMVDALVIGWTGNSAAFAAVGSVGPMTDVLIGLVWGFVTGAEILLAQSFGKGDGDRLRRVATSAISGTLGLGVIAGLLGILLHTPLLHILLGAEGDANVIANARTYLIIYFAGMPAMALYNIGCALLRSIGDTKRPLYFLFASSLLNILLDLLFVFVIPLGVAGVALATVLSQTAAAIPLFLILFRTETPLRLSLRRMKPELALMCRIFLLGLPGAIQASISSFANVFAQSYVAGANGSQVINLGGWSAYSRIYSFIVQPASALGAGVTILAAQCVGAGDPARARRGVRLGILLGTAVTVPLIATTMLLSSTLPYLFINDPEIVAVAASLLLLFAPCAFIQMLETPLRSGMRGAGDTFTPMVATLITAVGIRQIALFLVSRFISNDLLAIATTHPFTWVLSILVVIPFYFRTLRRIPQEKPTEA